MIKTEGLTKKFDDYTALDNVSCSIPDGCICGIVGSNGAGKSTLLRLITGIYKPDSIIVFKQSKDDAILAFKNICSKRPLLPKDFSNPDNIQEMEGLYVPFWLYNIENDCYIKADCTNVATWISGDYQYTKTDFYKVERGGYLTFENVPNVLNNKIFKGILKDQCLFWEVTLSDKMLTSVFCFVGFLSFIRM